VAYDVGLSVAGPIVVNLLTGTASRGAETDSLANVEGARASHGEHADIFIGNAQTNWFYGRGGNDLMIPNGALDYFTGQEGSDTIWMKDAPGPLEIDLATQRVTGAWGVELLGVENAIGGPFADDIYGDSAPNVLAGGGGGDDIDGRGGEDTADFGANPRGVTVDMRTGGFSDGAAGTLTAIEHVIGSAFADVFISDPGQSDSFDGNSGKDTLRFTGAPRTVTADLALGTAADGGGATDTMTRIESLVGGSAADILRGDGGANLLDGAAGNDRIVARGGKDTGLGGAGNDSLSGGGGDDTLKGGAGNDKIVGGAGRDLCRQGPGTGPITGCEV
jgi:Ca2+-binding RTX toxin-like protein